MKSARIRGQKASVSQGLLPEHSSRTSISAGVKRYKFKTVELGMPVPTENDLRNYQLALNYAAEAFDKARNAEPLCQSLRQIEFRRENWTTVSPEEYAKSELMNRLLEKRSVPVRMPRAAETQADDQRHSSSLQANGVAMKRGTNATAERLTVFEPRSLPYAIPTRRSLASEPSTSSNTYAGDGCVVYCGGPISVIASCPRLLEDGSECAAVSVFPDEEYLIDRNAANNISYLQLWRYERNSDSVSARLWFLLETNTGSVLTAVWCPILRGKVNRNKVKTEHCDRKANFVGVIAVGGLEGGVVIYGIPNEVSDLAQATEGICIMRSKPDLVLHLSDEYPDSPVISLAWSEFDGAARLAAVFASGHVGVWNMNNPLGAAKVIFDDRWVSPPVHIAFSEPNQLAISFREKCVRIYDSNQFECIIEETVPRSAGIKVASCERLFSGTFSYQGDCITTTEFLEHTMCYITLAPKEKNFFVVPLAFRHEVRLWDAAICPHSGCLYTVGADGRLEVSLNGHIVPRHAQIDFPFNSCRVAMTLVRKAKADHINKEGAVVGTDSLVKNEIGSGGDGEEAQSLRRIGTDLDSCAEQFTLEFSFDNIKHGKTPMDQISLDIRVESLNRVAVSQSVGRLVICGGEAGLLIFLPCQL
ncbi:hypothetical protein Tcan_04713 [Toxocara canis]|uniref:Uncharacterized protein n=1 Tax=Toxocara canis TaxID=6265 RepID=A0A0B2VDH7_TOXCA|nr:hypothetical protein Tcan_04713 [Toxocara canis]